MKKAVALYSGGLDSTLAILAVLRQGIDVTALTFLTHFGCDISDRSSCSKNPFAAAEHFGFSVKLCHLADKFIEIVKRPKFGHGRNMNPCMDCRILMLKEAGEFMRMTGAGFIITGEVLGQRPMSQRRDALNIIDREAGLRGHVLRPLSAQLLEPTHAEKNGYVDRSRLYAFSGRSRKPQMALAKEFGLTDYPAPAGGCLLTEPNYAHRLRELLQHLPEPLINDLHLLRIGRHFRFSPACRIIIGRDEQENENLLKLVGDESTYLRVRDFASPVAVIRGAVSDEAVAAAASLCARYSDGRQSASLAVSVVSPAGQFSVDTVPADSELCDALRIERQVRKEQVIRR